MRPPETAAAEDVRRFQVHQADGGMQPPTIDDAVSGLRFLFNVTLDRPNLSRRLFLARRARTLPTVLSVEEVAFAVPLGHGARDRAAPPERGSASSMRSTSPVAHLRRVGRAGGPSARDRVRRQKE